MTFVTSQTLPGLGGSHALYMYP